jgi:hypothetical protein
MSDLDRIAQAIEEAIATVVDFDTRAVEMSAQELRFVAMAAVVAVHQTPDRATQLPD